MPGRAKLTPILYFLISLFVSFTLLFSFVYSPAFGAEAKVYREIYLDETSDMELRRAGEEARGEMEKMGCNLTHFLAWRNIRNEKHLLIEVRCLEWRQNELLQPSGPPRTPRN